MGISASAAALNASAHTLRDLQKLATQSPQEAEGYLRQLSARLQSSGQPAGAQAIAAVLEATGSLVERINAKADQLKQIFPEEPGQWAALALRRQNTVGYTAEVAAPAFITGSLKLDPATRDYEFTTQAGRTFKLAESEHVVEGLLPRAWVGGFLGDGPITLQGRLGQDGHSINVEGFALNRDGRYDTFTFARVTVAADQTLRLATPQGPVAVADPELQAKLKAMPRLAVILPGEPTVGADGARVYTHTPERFFGLGAFLEGAVHPPDATSAAPYAAGEMAYHNFTGRVTVPPGSEDRIGHDGRVWLEGDVVLDGGGKAVRFESVYVSHRADDKGDLLGAFPDADAVETAVLATDVGGK